MHTHHAPRLGRPVSVIGLGTWQLGADWGEVERGGCRWPCSTPPSTPGVTFFDTADVYGDGRSERSSARSSPTRPDADVFVATKMGRRVDADAGELHPRRTSARGSTGRAPTSGVDTLDLVQLHCPPTAVFSDDAVFDDARRARRRRARSPRYGVSVETCDEALTAIARPNVASVQIILNAFRLKPLDEVLPAAHGGRGRRSSRACRWPRACCSGKYDARHRVRRQRPPHLQPPRRGVRRGRDVLGRRLRDGRRGRGRVRGVRGLPGPDRRRSPLSRWLAQQPAVTTVIPGARNVAQARSNASAGSVAPLTPEFTAQVDRALRPHVPRGDPRALVGASESSTRPVDGSRRTVTAAGGSPRPRDRPPDRTAA